MALIRWITAVVLIWLRTTSLAQQAPPGTFRLRFSSTTLNVANHFLNVPENSSGLVGGVSCLTDPFTNDTRLVYNITPNGVSGWYLNGSRLDDGTQGISISERVSSPVPMQFSFASLLIWPSVATRNLDGNYTCRVGSDSLVLVVHIQIPASILSISDTTNVTIGTQASISCEAEGDLPVTMVWYQGSLERARSTSGNLPLNFSPVVGTDSGLYTCTAMNAFGTSVNRSLTVTVQQPPIFSTTPVLTINSNTITTTSADFSVSAPDLDGNAPLLGYTVTCIPQAAYDFAPVVNESSTDLSVTVTGLHPGATYNCHFQAFNDIGASEPSLTSMLSLNDDVSAPPTNVSAVAVSSTDVSVTYQPPPAAMRFGDITLYELTYNATDCNTASGGCPCTGYVCSLENNLRLTGGGAGSQLLAGLRRFTTYTFTLQAVNRAGLGNVTTSSLTTKEDVSGPPVVTVLAVSLSSISVGWQAPIEPNGVITQYQLVFRPDDGNDTSVNVSASSRSYDIINQTKATPISVSLRAMNSIGLGIAGIVSASTGAMPIIDKSTSTYTYGAFTDQDLPCRTTSGSPAPTIAWTSPSIPSLDLSGDSAGSLLFRPVLTNSSGTYLCTATNVYGTDTHTVTVIAEYPPSIAITPAVQGRELTGNALYTLVCTGTGFPLVTSELTWEQGQNTLAGNTERTVLSNGVVQVTRTIMVAGGGLYMCTISSPSILTNTTAVPWTSPSVQSFTTTRASFGSGENASLLCLATGSPYPMVRILVGGVPIVAAIRLLTNNVVEATATVFSGGVYSCTVTNRAGTRNSTLTIQGPEESSSLIPGLEDMWLWIIIAVVAAVLLLVILLCICRRRRRTERSKTYRVKDELHRGDLYDSPGHHRQNSETLPWQLDGPGNVLVNNAIGETSLTIGPRSAVDGGFSPNSPQSALPTTFQPDLANTSHAASAMQHTDQAWAADQPGRVYYGESPDQPASSYPPVGHSEGASSYPVTTAAQPPEYQMVNGVMTPLFEDEGQFEEKPTHDALPTFTARHGDHILTAM